MELAPGTLVTPNVKLLRQLREGGMGSVWVAEHLTLRTQVAVKFISQDLLRDDPGMRARFEHEASLAAQIKSEHVVHTHDQGLMDDGTPYIVMELLEGSTLTEWIELTGPLSLHETCLLVTQLAKALGRAHKLGIIHRDIKADNVFLVDSEEEVFAKILDFGIAKHTRLPELDKRTKPGTIVGTPEFMSPEQMLADEPLSFRTDLWALGVVAYYGLTGELPFQGTTLVSLCLAVLEAKPRPPSVHRAELPPSVDAWFAKALSRDPASRFDSSRDMAEALQRAAEPGLEALPLELARTSRIDVPVLEGSAPDAPSSRGDSVADPSVPVARSSERERPRAEGSEREPGGPSPTFAGATSPLSTATPRRRGPWVGLVAGLAAVALGVGVAMLLEARGWDLGIRVSPPRPSSAPASSPTPAPTTQSVAAPDSLVPEGTLPPIDLVLVPAGPFTMGCNAEHDPHCERDELPSHEVTVGAFQLDRVEVTVAEYAACVKAGRCTSDGLGEGEFCNWTRPDRLEHPINCVDWNQASAYCEWVSMRLPTEAEWEKAARGDGRRVYPWGNEPPTCRLAVMDDGGDGCGKDSTWPVGSKPEGASPFGALDMAGNVWEWVADRYDVGYYARSPAQDPQGAEAGIERGERGGSWLSSEIADLRTSERQSSPASYRNYNLGFRCARNATAEALSAASAAASASAAAGPRRGPGAGTKTKTKSP
jgi:serine/threonine-protein kinase